MFLAIVLALSCTNATPEPACIAQMIANIKKQPVWNPPATIWQYTYNNKQVYLVTSDCCDQFISLYDENCNRLCAPSGGFGGGGDGQCPDFYTKATNEKLLWQDSRKR